MSDKLILANGTSVELESGATLGNIKVVFADKAAMVETWEQFTEENLKSVQVIDGTGVVIATYTDLVFVSVTSTEREDGSIVTIFALRQKSEVELLKEQMASQTEQTEMLTACVLEMSELVYV